MFVGRRHLYRTVALRPLMGLAPPAPPAPVAKIFAATKVAQWAAYAARQRHTRALIHAPWNRVYLANITEQANATDTCDATIFPRQLHRLNPDPRASQRTRHFMQRLARTPFVQLEGTACNPAPCSSSIEKWIGTGSTTGGMTASALYMNGAGSVPLGGTGAMSTLPPTMAGSGAVASGGSVTTTCCANALPNILFLTITDTGGCACLAGSYALVYDSGLGLWQYTGTACSGAALIIRFGCVGLVCNAFHVDIICNSVNTGFAVSSCTCSPLSVSFVNTTMNGCCAGGSVSAILTA